MQDDFLAFSRSKFKTRLPRDRLYTSGHFWMAPESDGHCRVGFTKFATRMLGEVVEFDFEVKVGAAVEVGQAIGWVEGFKAVTDLYVPLAGRFVGPNAALDADTEVIHQKPYDSGWLYRVEGTPPEDALDAEGYARFLDATIDRMMGESS